MARARMSPMTDTVIININLTGKWIAFMKLLVTGGAGFIGSHLCEKLVREGNQIVCVDNFNTYYDPAIKRRNISGLLDSEQFALSEMDICDFDSLDMLFKRHAFDGVVHLAARAGVRPSIEDPRLYQRVNVEGTFNLLELSKHYRVPKFVLASTSSIYGNNHKVPFSEEDNVDYPISPYAATKKACELIAYTYHTLHQLHVTCLRFFTVYGPRQRPDMAIHKFTHLIAQGKPIPFFGDGSSRRDYTYISDIIQGVCKAIDRCEGYHIYNLGESQTITLKSLVELIEKSLDKKAILEKLGNQPGDVEQTYADITRARNELDYRPGVPIEEGIPRFVDWYKETCQTNG